MGAAEVVVMLRDLLEDERHDAGIRLARSRLDPAPATSLEFAVAQRERPPASPLAGRVRSLTPSERTAVCHRDGFIDRLSPERWRLVYPGAIRVLSLELPGAFDTHPDGPWAYRANAPVWWDLWPTVDHLTPRARSGTNAHNNLACVSWWRNDAKGDRTLGETGWMLQPPGSPDEWDGLLEWFVDRVRRRPHLANDATVRAYLVAASSVVAVDVDMSGVAKASAATVADSPPLHDDVHDKPTVRCPKSVWATNSRGAYHSHLSQTTPKTWLAGCGTWRVIQHPGRRRTLERLVDGKWSMCEEGHSSDRLLAFAAETDRHEGVPASDPHRRCWLNTDS